MGKMMNLCFQVLMAIRSCHSLGDQIRLVVLVCFSTKLHSSHPIRTWFLYCLFLIIIKDQIKVWYRHTVYDTMFVIYRLTAKARIKKE
ncbi:uncharacterized protein BYT42DRAFT_195194 [Radiomyces spectabilis]|uniref:uncharacterized protein n=1 Tax=Radiomyces spectabilis TaxID=64574 RepID=UPI00221E3C21|nr:uncharacterized protein BYT42DRAFT_195194 [Radiomyces spectabilis]KAI8391464.1 hypothetical protein BYT42DRAFT_195194 [Radiomyces spectabilis]